MSRLRDIFNWFISLGKPSWEEEELDARRRWYLSIPRDELNDCLKCLANKISEDKLGSLGVASNSDCLFCRCHSFCDSIDRSINKRLAKYERKGKAR